MCSRKLLWTLLILLTFISGSNSARCCVSYARRRLRCEKLLGYYTQTINTSCDINAIIFRTIHGFVCSDPRTKRTQRAKSCVDKKKILDRMYQDGKPGPDQLGP